MTLIMRGSGCLGSVESDLLDGEGNIEKRSLTQRKKHYQKAFQNKKNCMGPVR
jgi:hypothetical protein